MPLYTTVTPARALSAAAAALAPVAAAGPSAAPQPASWAVAACSPIHVVNDAVRRSASAAALSSSPQWACHGPSCARQLDG